MEQYAFDLFVSYSHDDQLLARSLVCWLRKAGFRVWIDEEQLVPGSRFRAGLQQGVRESRHMLAILTPNYSRRPWTQRELDLFDLNADHSDRRVLAVQIGDLPQGPLDQAILVHARVPWAGRGTEFDGAGFWRTYCGLTGTRPGPREEWDIKGRRLVDLTPACSAAPAATRTPYAGTVVDAIRHVESAGELASLVRESIEVRNQEWRRSFDHIRNDVTRFSKPDRHDVLRHWWALGLADMAGALALSSPENSVTPYCAWAFLDLGSTEIAAWFLLQAEVEKRQFSEVWFSWAVAERCWNALPAAATLVPDLTLRAHFSSLAHAVRVGIPFEQFEADYNYGIMITPWNHFHLSWLALRLGDMEAAISHASMLCTTTTLGDVRTGRFLNRVLTWTIFERLRDKTNIREALDAARRVLGLFPASELAGIRQRLDEMWTATRLPNAERHP